MITTVNRKSVENVFKLNKNNITKIYKNNSIKRINVNAVLYSTNDNIRVLYGGYNQRSPRKTFGFASDIEFSEIIDDLREKLVG